MKKLLMIDNYDSFVYNLVQYIGEMGENLHVKRNNRTSIPAIKAMRPSGIIISPGPGRPEDAPSDRILPGSAASR